jgi:hypothetical protein
MNQPNIRTSSLLQKLFKAPSLKMFLAENKDAMYTPSLTEYLDRLCAEKSTVREQVISKAGIERTFGHQLFRGSRKVSRDNVLRLAFGFGLTEEETQELLDIARKARLCPKIKRDAVILYSLSRRLSIQEAQLDLNELGLTLLGGEKYEHSDR